MPKIGMVSIICYFKKYDQKNALFLGCLNVIRLFSFPKHVNLE